MIEGRLDRDWSRLAGSFGLIGRAPAAPCACARQALLRVPQRKGAQVAPATGENGKKTCVLQERKFAQAPKGRRAVMRRPQAEQGEGSAPARTEPVTAEAGASPNERQRRERPQARARQCFRPARSAPDWRPGYY